MIAVFCGTYNRTSTLARTLASFARLTTPHRIVIVDNGSDDPAALALLDDIDATVYRLPKVASMEALTANYTSAMEAEYASCDDGWFAVTDADICFDGSAPDCMDGYIRVAEATGNAVGPHLRINDIPAGYPYRSRVLATESRLLYADSMDVVEGVPCSAWAIDSTFHLFPRTPRFDRLRMNTLRCGPPYDAMHLDWYVDVTAPTAENWAYLNDRRPGIGSWGKTWLREFWRWSQRDPETAFRMLLARPRPIDDLCNTSFLLSWCFQYGHGCEVSREESQRWLWAAIPQGTVWWEHRIDWMKFIFDDDFSALGW